LIGKTYSDSTPAVTYGYGTGPNVRNHLTSVSNANSTTNYTLFDGLGRVLASNQVTAGQTYNFAYTYNLAGSLISESFPLGRVVTNTYDGANRTNQVAGMLGGTATNYVSNVAYAPHGGYTSFTLGNQLVPTFAYNNRLQTANWHTLLYGDPAEDYMSGVLNWGAAPNNNGSLQAITETNDGPSYPAHLIFNQAFTL